MPAQEADAPGWEAATIEQRAAATAELRERLTEYQRRIATARTHAQFLSALLLGLSALYSTLLAQTRLNKWLLGAALALVVGALLQTLWSARTRTSAGWRLQIRPLRVSRQRPATDAAERALRHTQVDRFNILARKVNSMRLGVWERYHRQSRITYIAMASILCAAASALHAAWPHILKVLP